MSYAIVGFGAVGQALAHAFARKNVDVTVASRRPPEALASQARAIGPRVVAKSGAVRRLVGIEVGVVSGVFNLESPGVDAPGWRLRHEEAYHTA